MTVAVFYQVPRGPGSSQSFVLQCVGPGTCPHDLGWQLNFPPSPSCSRKQNGQRRRSHTGQLLRKLPQNSHWPELRHSLAASVAGKCNLSSGAMFLAPSFGFCYSRSRRECISGHGQPLLPLGPCSGVWLLRVKSQQDAGFTFQKDCFSFFRNGQSDCLGRPVVVGWPRSSSWSNRPECQCTPCYPATGWVSAQIHQQEDKGLPVKNRWGWWGGVGVNCPLWSPGFPPVSEPSPLPPSLYLQAQTLLCLALRPLILNPLVSVGIVTENDWEPWCLCLWPKVVPQPPLYETKLESLQFTTQALETRRGLSSEPCVSLCVHLFMLQRFLSAWEPCWGQRDMCLVWILAPEVWLCDLGQMS